MQTYFTYSFLCQNYINVLSLYLLSCSYKVKTILASQIPTWLHLIYTYHYIKNPFNSFENEHPTLHCIPFISMPKPLPSQLHSYLSSRRPLIEMSNKIIFELECTKEPCQGYSLFQLHHVCYTVCKTIIKSFPGTSMKNVVEMLWIYLLHIPINLHKNEARVKGFIYYMRYNNFIIFLLHLLLHGRYLGIWQKILPQTP